MFINPENFISMKLKNIFLFTASFILLFAAACKKEAYKEVGTTSDKVSLITGEWKVVKLVQKDLDAIEYAFPYKEQDVTSVAPFNTSIISFQSGGTFTANRNNAPFFLPVASGNWALNDAYSPDHISLTSGTNQLNLELGALTLLHNNKLQFTVYRKLGDVRISAYTYELAKQ